MGKRIESPVKRWPGHVIIEDPLTFPTLIAWQDTLEKLDGASWGDALSTPRLSLDLLRGICAVVKEWHLNGLTDVTPETFPATPRVASGRLIAWLVNEISALYAETEDDPKG